MKAIIKYISLLLFSGLIIPFYHYHLPCADLSAGKKPHPVARQYRPSKKAKKRLSLINETVADIFPVLKNLL